MRGDSRRALLFSHGTDLSCHRTKDVDWLDVTVPFAAFLEQVTAHFEVRWLFCFYLYSSKMRPKDTNKGSKRICEFMGC